LDFVFVQVLEFLFRVSFKGFLSGFLIRISKRSCAFLWGFFRVSDDFCRVSFRVSYKVSFRVSLRFHVGFHLGFL
jgi:hypothetical protein